MWAAMQRVDFYQPNLWLEMRQQILKELFVNSLIFFQVPNPARRRNGSIPDPGPIGLAQSRKSKKQGNPIVGVLFDPSATVGESSHLL